MTSDMWHSGELIYVQPDALYIIIDLDKDQS